MLTKTRTLGLLSAATCLLLGGCNSSLFGTAASSSQTEIITAARILRLYQSFTISVVNNLVNTPTGTAEYDGSLYWYKATATGAVTTIDYFANSSATLGEGSVTVTNTSGVGADPQTYSVVLDITGLTRAVENVTAPTTTPLSLTIGLGNSPIEVSGTFTELASSGSFPITVDVTNTGGALAGTAYATPFTIPTTFTNLTGTTTGLNAYTLTGTVNVGNSTQTFTETLNSNGSGHASLADGTTLSWSQSGTGTLSTAKSGGDINIANVDGGQ